MNHLRALLKIAAMSAVSAIAMPTQLLIAGPIFKNKDIIPTLLLKAGKRIVGLSVKIIGEPIEKDVPVIRMANHPSPLDVFIMNDITDSKAFVMGKEFKKIPLLGQTAKSIGSIFASNGKSKHEMPEIHNKMTNVLNDGRDIIVFPEGSVCLTRELKRFKTGILSLWFNNLSTEKIVNEYKYQGYAISLKTKSGTEILDDDKLNKIFSRFVGEKRKSVMRHVFSVFGAGSIIAEVTVQKPLDPNDFENRRDFASAARQQLLKALE